MVHGAANEGYLSVPRQNRVSFHMRSKGVVDIVCDRVALAPADAQAAVDCGHVLVELWLWLMTDWLCGLACLQVPLWSGGVGTVSQAQYLGFRCSEFGLGVARF